jgi:hypothetical protein
MGALLTSILQGAGRAGSEGAQARIDEQARQLELVKQGLGLSELRQRISQQQAAAQRNTPEGTRAYLKGVLQREPTNEEVQRYMGVQAPQSPAAKPKYSSFRTDDKGRLWGFNDQTQREEQVPGGEGFSAPPKQDKEDLEVKWDEAMKIASKAGFKGPKQTEFARSLMPGGAQVNKLVFPELGKGSGSSLPEPMLKALADKWTNEGIKPPAKHQDDVELYMFQHGMKAKTKLNNQEQLVKDSIKQVTPMVDRMVKFLEENNLTQENSWVFGNHSAMMQHLRNWGYQRGKKPEPVTAELIKDSAAIQVMGARPWMTMGRSKYMYETVKQHLPNQTDTPGLLYDKLVWLRDNVLEDAKSSLPDANEQQASPSPPGQPPPQAPKGGSNNSDPLGLFTK